MQALLALVGEEADSFQIADQFDARSAHSRIILLAMASLRPMKLEDGSRVNITVSVTSRRHVERRIVRCYTGASFSRPRSRERPVELVDAMRVQSENAEVKMSKPSTWSFGLVFALAALGCGGAPRPEARIASSQGAIRGAEEAGAAGVPQAKLHLQLAQEQRQQALELIKNGDNHRAELLLARAEADAELAVALAREATAKAGAEKAAEDVEALKQRAAQ